MKYDWLFAFVVFAEHLNFTSAARQLHVSQPALHVQIKKLGEAVGRPLYRRDGKTLSLTPEGKQLASFGREVLARGTAVLEQLRGEPLSGPVVLASGQGAFLYLLGPAIRRFPKQRWPLRLLSMPGSDAIQAVRDARAHVCVVATEHPPADLSSEQLVAVGQKIVVPSSHRLARRRFVRAASLDGEKLVVAPAGTPHRTMVDQLLRAAGCQWTVAVEASGWELMLQFARYGLGAAIVNDFCAVPAGMVGVALEGAPKVTYRVLTRGGSMGEGAKALRKLIVDTVAA
jgi:DNA-binding transcriptional LysR family regulator